MLSDKQRDEIIPFYFYAMLNGFASTGRKDFRTADTHTKKYYFVPSVDECKAGGFNHGFALEDTWTNVTGTSRSAGYTYVKFHGCPVWVMQYQGMYKKQAIPFLKLALRKAFEAKLFNAGRGPILYTNPEHEGMVYRNSKSQGDWELFVGYEEIIDTVHNVSLGWHQVNGMYLFGKNRDSI
jgi:hypothetical protein